MKVVLLVLLMVALASCSESKGDKKARITEIKAKAHARVAEIEKEAEAPAVKSQISINIETVKSSSPNGEIRIDDALDNIASDVSWKEEKIKGKTVVTATGILKDHKMRDMSLVLTTPMIQGSDILRKLFKDQKPFTDFCSSLNLDAWAAVKSYLSHAEVRAADKAGFDPTYAIYKINDIYDETKTDYNRHDYITKLLDAPTLVQYPIPAEIKDGFWSDFFDHKGLSIKEALEKSLEHVPDETWRLIRTGWKIRKFAMYAYWVDQELGKKDSVWPKIEKPIRGTMSGRPTKDDFIALTKRYQELFNKHHDEVLGNVQRIIKERKSKVVDAVNKMNSEIKQLAELKGKIKTAFDTQFAAAKAERLKTPIKIEIMYIMTLSGRYAYKNGAVYATPLAGFNKDRFFKLKHDYVSNFMLNFN